MARNNNDGMHEMQRDLQSHNTRPSLREMRIRNFADSMNHFSDNAQNSHLSSSVDLSLTGLDNNIKRDIVNKSLFIDLKQLEEVKDLTQIWNVDPGSAENTFRENINTLCKDIKFRLRIDIAKLGGLSANGMEEEYRRTNQTEYMAMALGDIYRYLNNDHTQDSGIRGDPRIVGLHNEIKTQIGTNNLQILEDYLEASNQLNNVEDLSKLRKAINSARKESSKNYQLLFRFLSDINDYKRNENNTGVAQHYKANIVKNIRELKRVWNEFDSTKKEERFSNAIKRHCKEAGISFGNDADLTTSGKLTEGMITLELKDGKLT